VSTISRKGFHEALATFTICDALRRDEVKSSPQSLLPIGRRQWNAVDLSAAGRFVGVSVAAKSGTRKPRVLACTRSPSVTMGVQALEDVAARLPRKARWATVLSREDYQMIVVPEPPVLEAEVNSSLRWTIGPMIDFPAAEASIDWMRIPTAEFNPAADKQIYAVVAREALVKERSSLFERAKLPLSAVDVRETALRNIAALAEREGEAVCLVSLTGGGAQTIFTYRGELYLDRFIAQPLADIAGDDQLRRRFLDRLAAQLVQSLELIALSYPFLSIKRVLVAPSEEELDAPAYLATVLPLGVEALDLGTLFDLSAAPELAARKAQGAYLVALGAALREH
jgi:MSHA biogenesis protein MshI